MNIFILVLVAVGCCAQEGQLVVSSGSSDRDVQPSCEGICAAPVEDFEPTKEWQTIRENQAIPPGLHVRMNLETGVKEAKILEDRKGVVAGGGILPADDSIVLEDVIAVNDGSVVEDKSFERVYESLTSLPKPPQVQNLDLEMAREKLSPEEFRTEVIRLWKERQAVLKNAMDTMQDSGTYLSGLVASFNNPDASRDDKLNVLETMEWEVTDIDKAKDFNTLGGLVLMVELLNSKDPAIREHAAWVIGSAVKNDAKAQQWVLDYGAMPLLLHSMRNNPALGIMPVEKVKLDKKLLYALGAIIRNHANAQKQFVAHDGPNVLFQVANSTFSNAIHIKVTAIIRDLLTEFSMDATNDNEGPLQLIHDQFVDRKWCMFISKLALLEGNEDLQAELQPLLRLLDKSCQTERLPSDASTTIL